MHSVNIILWMTLVGLTAKVDAISVSHAHHLAIAGFIIAILWQHGSVRGFLRAKKPLSPEPDDAAIANGPRNSSSRL